MKLSETEWYLNDFLIYCQSKNLSPKTISSYEQTLKLFLLWLKNEQDLEEVNHVKAGHIHQYIAYVQERGKYTVVSREDSIHSNHPQNRMDYKKT
ncbi:hypothetical protein DJ93_1175 [Bacillus clarus]|uniref:Core-binding (CB) domain-containing protein n=1 Tax=Bacillus clarus TaxID=2338372 RepID=A0A090YLG7_9BACI|nr:hypothetical protein DJ93_1175 [Bacillus clarus]